jgi:Spy/CpxP family protein refolding chaperone
LQQLNLSSEQVQKILAIQEQMLKVSTSAKARTLGQASKELQTLIKSEAPANQIREKYREVQALTQTLIDASFDDQLAIRDVLTVEQRRQQAAKKEALFEQSQSRFSQSLAALEARGESVEGIMDKFEASILQKLNLSPEQTQKIQAIETQYRVTIQPLSPASKQLGKMMKTMMEGDASSAQVREQFRQMRQLNNQVSELTFDRNLAIRDVLKREQRRLRDQLRQDPANWPQNLSS